jgi:hypothetical protein
MFKGVHVVQKSLYDSYKELITFNFDLVVLTEGSTPGTLVCANKGYSSPCGQPQTLCDRCQAKRVAGSK